MTLLEEAKKIEVKRQESREYNSEEIELALAWLDGTIGETQYCRTMRVSGASNKVANVLKSAARSGKIVIIQNNK